MTQAPRPSTHFTGALFENVVEALLPPFQPSGMGTGNAAWQDPSGLRVVWLTSRDPVFATTTVTLRVLPPGQSVELVAKQSLSELLLTTAHSDKAVALLLAESVKLCCGLLAPRLYEHDPRKGDIVTTSRPELSANLLFDPPEQGPPTFRVSVPCAVCGKDFPFEFGTQGHALAVWGGGNLGFLHVECCGAVGVSLRL
jgi:hypothetical protein